MIIDNNLIAYEYAKDQFTPYAVTKSGEKDEDKAIYKNPAKENTVLILEDDIINSEGFGLKKGFYNIMPDKYMDNLLIYQKGALKAKIPVINMKVIATNTPKQQKIKKMSYARYQRHLKKEQEKYYKGENPSEIDYKKAKIQYINEQKAWVIIYNSNIVELTGIIKF